MKVGVLGCFTLLGGIAPGMALGAVTPLVNQNAAPRVDLGYAIHEATVNDTAGYYSFKNIRYGQTPVRFQPSVAVSTTNRQVNNGTVGFKCPQAYPEWILNTLVAGTGLMTQQILQIFLNDPAVGEDCLFLDIVVPKKAFATSEKGAPVMVWLHGGGYVFGHKNDDIYNPSGLITQSQVDGSDGFIFVAINYRLGLFGWLNGDGDDETVPNIGLLDQTLAFAWIKSYIHLFGGDPDNITVMGQSAGAGSIIHHITARGGMTPVPFRHAIVQSPGWERINVSDTWNKTLTVASQLSGKSVTTGKDLAALNFTMLNQINGQVVFGSSNGSFTYGPTVDKAYVPDHPEALLIRGEFDPSPKIMAGHNANEAGMFVSPDVDTEEELVSGLSNVLFKNFFSDSVDYILTELYPQPQNTDLYKTQYQRASLIVSESSFVCNTRHLSMAFGNQTFNYRFQVSPAVHAQDLPWTFYHNGNNSNGTKDVFIPTLAQSMQLYFTNFIKTGDPNANKGREAALSAHWPEYGDEGQIVTFGIDGVGVAEDDAKNRRCAFWQKGEYLRSA